MKDPDKLAEAIINENLEEGSNTYIQPFNANENYGYAPVEFDPSKGALDYLPKHIMDEFPNTSVAEFDEETLEYIKEYGYAPDGGWIIDGRLKEVLDTVQENFFNWRVNNTAEEAINESFLSVCQKYGKEIKF